MTQTRADESSGPPDDLRAKAEGARRELAREEKRVSPDAGSGSEPPGEDVEPPDGASEVVRRRGEDQRLEAAQESARQELRARRSVSD
jgi:hypothetical protein